MTLIKRVYHPEQRPLNLFIDGLPPPAPIVDKTSFVEAMTPMRTGYFRRERLPHDEISRTVLSLRGLHVVICPTCLVDVEPSPDDHGEVTFCQCPKCNNYYFVFELINQRNLRIVSKGEDTSGYFLYADGEVIAEAYQNQAFDYRGEDY